ncbi:MAG: 3'-5' exonuclease [Hydrotalea sp. AMD]|uniref:3'-5' exonuclease n=1 Tax=Hydrotalea sp. AMD TaxID=2501297 RepID=UPI00102701C0|nr:3'-5' exonuclease [Hydrotalea sp. AMD]RWZ87251.1 MAG: 3'-5' exonuclease [Hydrotalea sp. AMD]
MSKSTPRGYITRLLALDCETSGICNGDDPSFNRDTGEYCQAVSWGLIVVDATTLNPIDELYLEIKWDGKSIWSPQAEKIHGLSKQYLAENGITRSEAVEHIGNLIIDHWGPFSPVHILGHNPHFDLAFLKSDLRSEGLEVKFGNKRLDTNSIGFGVYGTHNSDDLFETIGLPPRKDHNALDDARSALKVFQTTRLIANTCFGD